MLNKISRRSDINLLALLHEGGYKSPTPLQNQVIPYMLKRRSLMVEAVPGEGINGTFLLPLLIKKPSLKPFSVLVLTASGEDARKTAGEYQRLTSTFHQPKQPRPVKSRSGRPFPAKEKAGSGFARGPLSKNSRPKSASIRSQAASPPRLICLGMDDQAKKELKLLSTRPAIIVGTPERIIDHIRRGNIELTALQQIIVHVPFHKGNQESFNKDVVFILSKAPGKVKTVVFTAALDQAALLSNMLKRPRIITRKERERYTTPVFVYQPQNLNPKNVSDIMFSRRLTKTLIYCTDQKEVEALGQELGDLRIPGETLTFPAASTLRHTHKVEETAYIKEIKGSFDTEELYWAATTDYRFSPARLGAETVLYYGLPAKTDVYINSLKGFTSIGRPEEIIILTSQSENRIITTLQENNIMNVKREELPAEEDVIKGKLESMLKAIKEDEDPHTLNDYKKLIKKNVPITMRGYLAAYLLKNAAQSGRPVPSKGGNTKTIFVSVGKNRKVFPKDLSKLFIQELNAKPDQIGSIKVLDNYSFVEVDEAIAKKSVDILNGTEFRGRTITVNFARKRPKNGNRN